MEEVNYNLVDRDAFLPVLPGNRKYFLLCTVAQLALPQSHQAVRKHGSPSCHGGISFQDFFRVFSRADPVIHLLRASCNPLRHVAGKGNSSHCRVVPQQAVSQGTDHERYGNLAVSLCQFQHGAFQVQVRLLVLAHAVDLFFPVWIETDRQRILAAADIALPFPVHDLQAAAGLHQCTAVGTVVFPQDQFPVAVKTDHAGEIHGGADAPVPDFSTGNTAASVRILFRADLNYTFRIRRFLCQGIIPADPRIIHDRAYTQRVFTPSFNPKRFSAPAGCQGISFLPENHSRSPLL